MNGITLQGPKQKGVSQSEEHYNVKPKYFLAHKYIASLRIICIDNFTLLISLKFISSFVFGPMFIILSIKVPNL